MDKSIAVVILNWNGAKLLSEFLPSVVRYTSPTLADIYVADNGSTDESISILERDFPTVHIIMLDKNYGFAEGYNKAIEQVNRPYTLLLNSDVAVTEGWLMPLYHQMENNPKVGAIQPKIKSYRNKTNFEYAGAAGGYIDYLGYPFCRGRIFGVVEQDLGQYDSPKEIFWASGAALMIRTELYKETGGLDNTFFAHMEEIDLCWRIGARGYKIVCEPSSTVYHLGAATLSKESPRKTYLNFRNNLLMLYKNLPHEHMQSTLCMRLVLDTIAAIKMFGTGQIKNACAVIRAIKDFYSLKKKYHLKRMENLDKASNPIPSTLFAQSILYQYYIKRKSKYSNL